MPAGKGQRRHTRAVEIGNRAPVRPALVAEAQDVAVLAFSHRWWIMKRDMADIAEKVRDGDQQFKLLIRGDQRDARIRRVIAHRVESANQQIGKIGAIEWRSKPAGAQKG